MTENRTARINELLTQLENAASTPVVPGELRAWCENIARPFGALGEEWAGKEEELESVFKQIEKEDVEIIPRVEKMREKQSKISVEFVRLEQMLSRLLKADSNDPKASWEPTTIGQTLRQDLLHLALRCRTLDKEANTWFIEATHRDRGTGD